MIKLSNTDKILITGLALSYAGIAIQFGNGYALMATGVALMALAITAKFNGAE